MSGTLLTGRRWRHVSGFGQLGLLLFGPLILAGCLSVGPRPLPTVRPTFVPVPSPTMEGGDLVVPELVGSWTQDASGASTGYFLRSEYTFAPDGEYALTDRLCITTFDGTTCQDDDSPEAGVAATNGNQLLLSPTTASDLGRRTYTFAVVRDPNLGDLRLQFFMQGYVDEWFWVPPQ
jgi:hypothetical protein